MADKKNIMTYAGLKKLEEELHDLKVKIYKFIFREHFFAKINS